MSSFATIVIGASLGGVEALRKLVAGVPRDIPAAIFVVQHVGKASILPELLAQAGPLPAAHATHDEQVRPGRIFVAPPDHHLILSDGTMRLTRGPRENWARPAIDPLFRSAAKAYGSRVIGVILTGMLNDGAAGLRAVAACGGTTVVQTPADATCPQMPWSALRHVNVNYTVPLRELPGLLNKLATQIANAPHKTAAKAGGLGYG